MKKIVVIGGSNSRNSINKTFALYAANKINDAEVITIDLNDFKLPIYGVDLEREIGIPDDVIKINTILEQADALIISLAEHNGSFAAVFKNVIDWLSRINQKVWKDRPMLLMSTSLGARGGITVLESAKGYFPYLGGNIVADFSLPSFNENFSENGISNEVLNANLNQKIELLQKAM